MFQPAKLKKMSDEQLNKLKISFKENGFKSPFYVWQDKEDTWCLDGHTRIPILKLLENEGHNIPQKLPANFVDCKDKKEAKKAVLIYNSHYANIIEDELFEFIKDLNIESIRNEIDIAGIEFDIEEEKKDNIPIIEKIKSLLGDIYLLGNHKILCSDSADEAQMKLLMGNEKANMIFTDPSHNFECLEILGAAFKFCVGIKFIMHSDKFLSKLVSKNIDRFETFFIHDFILHIGGGNRFYAQHDLIACFDYDKKKYNNLKDGFSTIIRKMSERQAGTKNLVHKHQKPVFLIEQLIIHFTKIDDIILDIFLGSGSTLIAAEKTQRKCYGMEIDSYYVDVIVQRYINYMQSLDNCYLIRKDKKIKLEKLNWKHEKN